jgi:hypothetical protein
LWHLLGLYARSGFFISSPPTEIEETGVGKFTFAHDGPIDWILKRGDALEELVLDDAPILSYI